jgi:two-component system, NtrC family, sensor histidine kinase HydH
VNSEDRAQAGQLVSDLAHELKTPIAAIRGFAELLEARDDEATRREASVQILTGVTRLSEAIDELLAAFLADPELPLRLAQARVKGAGAD